jgi:hypothetical protein
MRVLTTPQISELRALLEKIPAGLRPNWEVHEDTSTGCYDIRTVLDGDADDDGRMIIVGGEAIAYMADVPGEYDLCALIVSAINAFPQLLDTADQLAKVTGERDDLKELNQCFSQVEKYTAMQARAETAEARNKRLVAWVTSALKDTVGAPVGGGDGDTRALGHLRATTINEGRALIRETQDVG